MSTDPVSPVTEGGMMQLRVQRKACIATDIFLFDLAPSEPRPLPCFSAGAHVTVLTPNGLTRRYSLCNGPDEAGHYRLAVKRDPGGQGGSVNLVDQVHVGDLLPTSVPLNYFSLDAAASSHLLIAGGIGITPLLAMVRELQRRSADFKLIYLTRSPETAAFCDLLQAPGLADRVLLHHDRGDPALGLDLAPWLRSQPAGGHLYCCGPRGLMHAVREQTRDWSAGSVHFEDFGGSDPQQAGADRPFAVKLARSGTTVMVPSGVSILEALRRERISVPSSCESGTCGSCRTTLLAGEVEHRDMVLSDEEKTGNIMVCVSRAKSPELVLDL